MSQWRHPEIALWSMLKPGEKTWYIPPNPIYIIYNPSKSHDNLVGGLNPSEKIWNSVGMIIPNWMESHKNHVPNHQPDDNP